MIEFFSHSRALLPLFVQIAQMGLILPRWDLNWPRIPLPTPVIYPAAMHPFGDMYVHKTPPKHPKNTLCGTEPVIRLTLLPVWGYLFKDSESIAIKVCSQIGNKWKAMIESHVETCNNWTSFDFWFKDFFEQICWGKNHLWIKSFAHF